MSDDPLRELLSSPLDGERARTGLRADPPNAPRRQRSGRGGSGPWLVGAILTGALAVLGGYLLAADDGAAVGTTAATTTTPPVLVVEPVGVLPAGYTAVGDRLGVKVERILVRPDAVFVSLSSVVPNTLAPDESSGFQGGLWSLVLSDGRRIESIRESTDVAAPGFVTVQFPPGGYGAADITGVALRAVAHRSAEDIDAAIATLFTVPADGTAVTATLSPSTFSLDAGVDLVFSDLTVSAAQGGLSWTVAGTDGEARAIVYPYLEFVSEDGAAEVAAVRIDNPVFGFFFAQSFATRPVAREGSILFDPPEAGPDATFPTGTPLRVMFQASVSWAVYSPESVTIPIGEDVLVTELG